ncbi:MAG: LptF/LptG family permease [Planctomycetales bacterium]|nr:LptF/LptG family permease [Planctomycetales bacterium]
MFFTTQITRYILAELLKVFLIALFGMTAVMILAGVVQTAVNEGLGLAPILRIIPYVLPNALRFAVPGTILFATCSVYGRLASNNEVTALKSLGISPVALLRPAWVLAFLVSLVAVWLNDIAVSWGTTGVRRVVIQSIEDIAYGMLRTHKTYEPKAGKMSISVQRVDGHRLIRPTISIRGPSGSTAVTVTASTAEMRYNEQRDTLSVFLTNAEATGEVSGDVGFGGHFPSLRREIPLNLNQTDEMGKARPADCPSRKIPGEIRHQAEVIQKLEQEMAARAAFDMFSGDLDGLSGEEWKKRRQTLGYARSRMDRLRTEPWRRWANGFSCFCFVLVGAPLAMYLRNSDLFTTFATCFFPILVIYYPLLMVGIGQAKSGALPPYCVWLGNVILMAISFVLVRRVSRY